MKKILCVTFRHLFISLIGICLLGATAKAHSTEQGDKLVNIPTGSMPLKSIFQMIEDQTGLSFFYSTKYVKDQEEASAPGNNQKLDALLKRLFEGKSITWQYKEERIVLMPLKPEKYDMTLQDIRDMLVDTLIDVKGRVKGPDDLPIEGATISIVGTLRGAKSDAKGDFTLNNVPSTARIRVTYLGFDTVMVRANSASISNVVLRPSMVMLKAVETVSTGYQDLDKDRAPPRTLGEGVYRFSRRLILVSRGPRRRALRKTKPLEFPRPNEASRPGEPVSEAGAPPHGRGRTDSHHLGSS